MVSEVRKPKKVSILIIRSLLDYIQIIEISQIFRVRAGGHWGGGGDEKVGDLWTDNYLQVVLQVGLLNANEPSPCLVLASW